MANLERKKQRNPRSKGPIRRRDGGRGRREERATLEDVGIESVRRVLQADGPADQLLRSVFRENKWLSRRDRGAIADLSFAVLRERRLFSHLAESGRGPLARRLALIANHRQAHKIVLPNDDEANWLEHLARIDRRSLAPAIQVSLPDWLVEHLRKSLSEEQIMALGRAFLNPASLDIRVNLLKVNPPAVMDFMANEGISAAAPGDAAFAELDTAIRLQGHPALERMASFAGGWFEVQDVGSQLIAHLAGAKRGQTVVDFCAGAGGKTLALASAMRSRGQIYACDISARRLARLKPRLARSGATNVQPMAIESEHDGKLKRLRRRADLVLVDAPCSGTGTLRRNPDLKWRHGSSHIQRLTEQQLSILKAASELVKPGGRLVYATCSLLRAENDEVALKFEAESGGNFQRNQLPGQSSTEGIEPPEAGYLQLWPHMHEADGFFLASWTRQPS